MPPKATTEYINSAEKKGYSGTLIYTRVKPLNAWNGIGWKPTATKAVPSHWNLRITTSSMSMYPTPKTSWARIDYRMQWEDDLRAYLKTGQQKPVILCGDLNVAHEDIDLKNPGPNRGAAGFSDQERGKLNELLAAGFTDSFRYLYPDATGMYSWWSMRFRARERNAGWRIDYFLVSDRLAPQIKKGRDFDGCAGQRPLPGAAGTVTLQNVQEIFGVSKKLCLSFAEHVGIKHVGVHDLTPHVGPCHIFHHIILRKASGAQCAPL